MPRTAEDAHGGDNKLEWSADTFSMQVLTGKVCQGHAGDDGEEPQEPASFSRPFPILFQFPKTSLVKTLVVKMTVFKKAHRAPR